MSIEVLLIVPAFTQGLYPIPSVSYTKEMFKEKGIGSKVVYSNLKFKRKIGPDLYERMAQYFWFIDQVELIFSIYAFPELKLKQEKYLLEIQQKDKELYKTLCHSILKAGELLAEIKEELEKSKPKVVYFSVFDHQMLSSIAITKIVKEILPDSKVIFGGKKLHSPVGNEILNIVPGIDYILAGEDIEKNLFNLIISILYNENNKYEKYICCDSLQNLDDLPFPDYSDFIEQADKLWLYSKFISFESSRGCWHGQNKHCIFCSLNGNNMSYRKKSPERTIKELDFLTKRYSCENVFMYDTIIPLDYPEKVFNSFHSNLKMFYEFHPKLKYEALKILKESGFSSCQVGIESLSSNPLNILNKGTTVENNIRFLRDCKELNINVIWNLLARIPGDKEKDYINMIELIPHIVHLKAPREIRPLSILRSTPLFENHKYYNIENLKPLKLYEYIFPEDANIFNLAQCFSGDYLSALDDKKLQERISNDIKNWQLRNSSSSELTLYKTKNSYFIKDTRYNEEKKYKLSPSHIKLLKEYLLPKKEIEKSDEIKYLLDNYLIIFVEDSYISLVENTRSFELF